MNRSPAIRIGTVGLLLALLAASVGLDQLCLCGACPLSFAMGVGSPDARPDHGCCASETEEAAAARPAAVVIGARKACGCDGDDHGPELLVGTVPHERYGPPAKAQAASATLPDEHRLPAVRRIVLWHTQARAPPDPTGPPLFVRLGHFLI